MIAMNLRPDHSQFLTALGSLRSDVAARLDQRQDEQGRWQCSWCRDFKNDDEFESHGSLCCLACVQREREFG